MPVEITQSLLSARELLPQVLHELAQPVSALQCSLEVALQRPRGIQDYVVALENAQEITNRLRSLLESFRELSEAVEPCDCLHPVDAAETINVAIQQMQPLADALGSTLEGNCDSRAVYGSEQKLSFIFLRLLDAVLASQQDATLQWMTEETVFGRARVRTSYSPQRAIAKEHFSISQTALETIGGKIVVEPLESGTLVTVQLASYRHPTSTTSVMVGDF